MTIRSLCLGGGSVLVLATGLLLYPHFYDAPLPVSGVVVPTSSGVAQGDSVPGAGAAKPGRAAPIAAGRPAERAISTRSRAWVERLTQPGSGGPLTSESAAAWDETLTHVIAAGPEAVPAIREFLAKHQDNDLGAGALRILGYDSVRAAMFDALLQIGGKEAEAALASTLAETLVPREIALLARNLERMAPGQYGQAAVESAWQSLAAGAQGAMGDRDFAPVFEVINRYGGAAVATDLEGAAGRWNYYATLSLAQLPEGAGVSALVRLAEGSVSGQAADPAIRILGSLASQNEEARLAFLELARNNRVAANTWNQLAPILAGAQLQFAAGVFGAETPLDQGAGAQHIHLSHGNQNFWIGMPAVAVRAEQWEGRLAWLDQLSAVATNPAAQAAIQQAWKLILVRLNPLTASVP